MKTVKKHIKTNKYLIFCFAVAFVTLLITSKNSFLYVLNDWVDANAFFTVGKSMFNNIIPYKDLFEQKGPLLYLIYGLGYLISNKSFHGVFIFEVLSFAIFLYYIHKIFTMYFKEKYSLAIIPAISMLITISGYFVDGGSCEEFCFPMMAVSLYYYFKHFKKEELTNKEILINGLMAGCVLMMKYTLLGFWIGICAFICINYLIKKEYKKVLKYCLFFLAGMLIPFTIGLIYFLINNGVKEFINVYFTLNMTSYTNIEHNGMLSKIVEIIKFIFDTYKAQRNTAILLLCAPAFAIFTKDKAFKLSLVGIIYMTIFFIFFGLKIFVYYHLPIFTLGIIVNMLFLLEILKKYIDKIIDKKYIMILFIPYFIIVPLLTYRYANYKEKMKLKKEDLIQYKYAEYINKYENPTLLNVGFLDIGVYTTTGIMPNTRFFQVQNFDYEKFSDNLDEIEKYIKEKKVKFIVYIHNDNNEEPAKYIYKNYDRVYKDIEGTTTIRLFKLKGIKEAK